MPIDAEKAVGAEFEGGEFSWSDADIVLYNLGVGAGNPPTSPDELKYAYEADLAAVPTYGTIPPFEMMMMPGQQALLYRMASGDKNPLHADPGFAAFAGFDRPILHGLCTYGVVCKAVVESALGGDPERVDTYTARFTGHVFPGETLVTGAWEESGRYLIETETRERGTKVLANASISTR